jgi:tetratricopeptide (TPR) repeat protein
MRSAIPVLERAAEASVSARCVALTALFLVAFGTACAPKRVHERPVMENGDRVGAPAEAVERARADARREQVETVGRRDELAARALDGCAPAVCAAIARGEVALDMSEAQVLAATRTTESAWAVRDAGGASVMVPASLSLAPRDAIGVVALVQLRDGRVQSYSYREAQGLRVVSAPHDATTDGRASALAEALLREGDDYAARGDLAAALDRYDRAHILGSDDPRVTYRIATTLDKQLRPVEALIQYQLFLHELELEKIDAYGRAYGNLADAIAHARERVIVLEKR